MLSVRFFLLSAALGCLIAAPANATVIYETDFTSAEGFNSANLLFQDGWLGQNFTNVDATGSGTASSTSTGFPRNLNNRGALGNLAGAGGAGEIAGPGFTPGDRLRVTAGYQLTLTAGLGNFALGRLGVDNAFATAGFDAQPVGGIDLFYSGFDPNLGGSFRLFSTLGRNGSNVSDLPFALIIDGNDIGIDDTTGDLESDLLEIVGEWTYLGGDLWQTSELSVSNLTTGSPLASAAADNPTILSETQTIASSNDLFLSVQWNRGSTGVSTYDSLRYEFFAAVPEPSSFALLALTGVAGVLRRRV